MAKSLAQIIAEEAVEQPAKPKLEVRKPPPPDPGTAEVLNDLSPSQRRKQEFAWQFVFGAKPFNVTEAYQAVVPDCARRTATVNGSKWLREPFVQSHMAQLIHQAAERHQLDEDLVLGHWLSMAEADIFDYFEVQEDGDLAGHLVVKAKELNTLPKKVRQNVKKMTVRNSTTKFENGERHDQTIEIEIVDRAAAVKNIAIFLGMMKGKEGVDIEDLAEEIRLAEERARHQSVTINHDTGLVEKRR